MNKKLLETRLNSVAHYIQEIENLEHAKRVTEATLNDLVNSFIEFVPYKKGDVLLRRDTVFKVAGIKEMGRDSNGIYVKLNIHHPSNYGGYLNNVDTTYIPLSKLDSIKILFSEPEKTDE
jgi:hypothetical protein